MGLAYDKLTALAILRARRSMKTSLTRRVDLPVPKPPKGKRWTREAVSPRRFCERLTTGKVYVAVPSGPARIRTTGVVSTVRSSGLPKKAFVDIGDGFAIAGPELLFVEMGALMTLPTQVMLGMELCGTFSRDPLDPRMGDVTYGLDPVTSVEKLTDFVGKTRFVAGLNQTREALAYVADNAWSPMEATIATMSSLPVTEFGYNMGHVRLNMRVEVEAQLQSLGAKASRVPDVLFEGTPVGINYDGKGHFDLDGLVGSAQQDEGDVEARKKELHAKLVDDLRRTRELAAAGYVVLPATSEDLFGKGGLDALMLEAMCAIEHFTDRDLSVQKYALRNKTLAHDRQRLIWSLLPWAEATVQARKMLEKERRAGAGMTSSLYEFDSETGEFRRIG